MWRFWRMRPYKFSVEMQNGNQNSDSVKKCIFYAVAELESV